MAKDGPVSPVFFHFTSMNRTVPFDSHGLANDPTPLEPVGQSRGGSGGVAEALGASLAEGAGADTGGAASALFEGDAPAGGSSFEQPRQATLHVNSRVTHAAPSTELCLFIALPPPIRHIVVDLRKNVPDDACPSARAAAAKRTGVPHARPRTYLLHPLRRLGLLVRGLAPGSSRRDSERLAGQERAKRMRLRCRSSSPGDPG